MNMGRLIDTLVRHEGSVIRGGRHMPYKDTVGKLTIGYGRNLTDKGLSQDEARTLLLNDVQETINAVRSAYDWFDSLDDVRQEVVINMAFNMGLGGFSTFKNTIRYINQGNYMDAALNMLKSKWAGQVKRRAIELSEMMRTGEPL